MCVGLKSKTDIRSLGLQKHVIKIKHSDIFFILLFGCCGLYEVHTTNADLHNTKYR